ncbi:hypothetical protein GCM10007967_02120 [Xylanimonas ulmi]
MRDRSRMRRRPGQAGQAVIELVGFVFLVVLATLLCVQGVFAAQAASAAQEAARNGARALSLGQDWRAVVDETLPDWARADVVEGGADRATARVRVAVRVPIGLRQITSGDLRFESSAQMPVRGR